jgi:Domain of unknown function (DUF4412)
MPRIPSVVATVALAVALAPSTPAAADTLLTIQGHHDSFNVQGHHQPAEDSTVQVWLGKDAIRRDDGKNGAILRSDKKQLVLIDHQRKTYSVVALPIDFDALIPADAKGFADAWKMTAEVTPKDETKKIGQWNARRYDVDITNSMGLAIHTVLWASRDLPIDYDHFKELSLTLAGLQPGGAAAVKDLAKVDGFPVQQDVSFDMAGQVVHSTENLQSVEEKPAPPGTYEPPAGYTEKPFNPVARGGAPGPGAGR